MKQLNLEICCYGPVIIQYSEQIRHFVGVQQWTDLSQLITFSESIVDTATVVSCAY
jgi:hypothetical protein